jgi:hypothetical protein
VSWFGLSALLAVTVHPVLPLFTLFGGSILVDAIPRRWMPSDPLARAVTRFSGHTMGALFFATAATCFMVSLYFLASFYLTNTPLPDYLSEWRRDIILNLEASILTLIAFTNGFAGAALHETCFGSIRDRKGNHDGVSLLSAAFKRFAKRYTRLNNIMLVVAIIPGVLLSVWPAAQHTVEELLSGWTVPALTIILASIVLAAICNGANLFHALPSRLVLTSRLIWRLAYR